MSVYLEKVNEQIIHFETLKTDILSEKKCPGIDFPCLNAELQKLGTKSSNELSFGANLLTYLVRKKLEEDKECAVICKADLHAKFVDSMLTYLEGFSLKSTYVYSLPPQNNLEYKLMQATEDLLIFKTLETIEEKTGGVMKSINVEKVFNEALAKKVTLFETRIRNVSSEIILKDSSLKSLREEDPAFKALEKAGGKDPRESAAYIQLIKQFRKK